MRLQITISAKSTAMLKKLHKDFKKGFIAGMRKAMFFAEAKAKKSFGTHGKPKVKTGHLRRSIRSGVKVTSSNAIGFLSSDVIYAPIHEFGGVIRPITSDWLRFQIGGQWITTKQVYIPERPYLRPAIEDNINKIEKIIKDTIFDKVK